MKYLKLVLKNVLRNKRRTILTVSSLTVSLFLIITLATVFTEFRRGSKDANPLRLVTRHAVSLTFYFPIAYVDRLASIRGVRHVLPYHWYNGVYKDDMRHFFANFAVDPKLLKTHQPETLMPDDQWQAFIADRQGAIVGRKLVLLHGFQIGQRVTLPSPIYRNKLEFIIRGIYSGGDEKVLFFHWDYLNEAAPRWAKDRLGTIGIMAQTAEDVPRIAKEADAMFLNTDAPTKTENEREFAMSFEAMMGGVKQFLYGIIGAIVFSLLLVTANTMAMSVRERTREVGTLKALGFQRGTIAGLFVAESVLLSAIGAAIGVGGAALLYRAVDLSLFVPQVFIAFIPETRTLVVAFAMAILVGVVSVAYSAVRVSRMTIAEALRSVE